jgi:hypothetical protein
MSDEEFLSHGMPPEPDEIPVTTPDPVVVEEVVDASPTVDQPQPEGEVEVADPAVVEPTPDAAPVNPLAQADDQLTKPVVVETPVEKPEKAAPETPEKEVTAVVESETPDYEGFFKKVMTPFKANGKMVELKSPDEAVSLMQMGANYTRKMQELVPHRKMLTMLQNHEITEDRLSFLIDLDKKNPEAVKKLIKDSGIDVLDLDTTAEPAYLEGNHRVTDEEVNFRTALEELGSNEDGQRTLQDINTRWDQASKEQLWKQPETMAIIHRQREAGVYDRVVAEMDRRSTLGVLPPGTPFLTAYQLVGNELTAQGAFQDLAGTPESQPATPVEKSPAGQPVTSKTAPIATRVATPKPAVNGDQASAAASARTTPRTAKETINPLALSDEEFLKQFEGRF